jgi:hypothetical protein
MSSPTEVVGRTLTLYLPESLVAETGRQTLEALGEAVAGGELDRVRLDASHSSPCMPPAWWEPEPEAERVFKK